MIHAFKEARVGALLAVLWAVWGMAFAMGEVIPVNDGLGWDGVRFSKMVEDGPKVLPGREINRYYVQRVGPSFAVRGLLQAVGAPLDPSSIRVGFVVLNLSLLSLALVLLMNAAERFEFSAASRWVLLIGLFLNPANGRLPIYYAPLGDSTAFFLGALALWGHLTRRPAAMIVAFLLAIVSWPAAFLLLPLLIWPRADAGSDSDDEPRELRASESFGTMIAAIPFGLVLLELLIRSVDMPDVPGWSVQTVLSVGTNALMLGAAAGFAAVVAVVNRGKVFSRPSIVGMVASAVLIALTRIYVTSFESGSLAFGFDTFAHEMILFARGGVFAAAIGHVAYYGGLAVGAIVLWPEILRRGLKIGTGAFVALTLCGLIAFDAESRRLNAYWPLVAFIAALALDRLSRGRKLVAFVVALLVFSKLWWPMTGPLLFAAAHDPGNYFNTQGPSLSTDAALVQGVLALAFGAWLWFSARSQSIDA